MRISAGACALSLAALLTLSACSGTPDSAPTPTPSPTPTTLSITGTLSLSGITLDVNGDSEIAEDATYSNFWTTKSDDGSTSCYGKDGYDDVSRGHQITVYDPSGTILAVAPLDSGALKVDPDFAMSGQCVFSFTVRDVPKHPLYQFGLGNRPRLTMDAAEVRDGVALSLG